MTIGPRDVSLPEGSDTPTRGADTLRHSRRFSNELIEDARKLFQEQTDRKLTAEDGRQILENLTGFFSVLGEWDRANARREEGSDNGEGDSNGSYR